MPAEKRKGNSKKQQDVKGKKASDLQEKSDKHHGKSAEETKENQDDPSVKYKSTGRRIVVRLCTIVALLVGAHMYLGQADSFVPFARQTETHPAKFAHARCSEDFNEDRKKFPECAPKTCGRGVLDTIVSEEEAKRLLQVAKRGLSLGGSNGGASILDLHSGALSKGDSFINIYKLIESGNHGNIFSKEDITLYKRVADRIKVAIAGRFFISKKSLHLTQPTFFSRMTNKKAKTVHDEYWHPHVDKTTYETFDYTSLLYLTDYGVDFQGGRFVFVDPKGNLTVEPKLGRVSFFTSGSENTHHVEKVTSGTRYAITVSFTCDEKHAIKYPTMGS